MNRADPPRARKVAPASRRRLWAIAVVLGCAAGCVGTTGHLAAVSTRPIDARLLASQSPAQHVVGRSCIEVVVVVPTAMPKFGDAVTDALQKGHGEVLTNVRIGYEILDFPFVYGIACYVVEGDAR